MALTSLNSYAFLGTDRAGPPAAPARPCPPKVKRGYFAFNSSTVMECGAKVWAKAVVTPARLVVTGTR